MSAVGAAPERACVYTCLLGGYEALNEQDVAAGSGLDFICFTDDPGLTSRTWRIVPIAPLLPADPVRSQRVVKLCAHEVLPDYDVSLYIDNSIVLKVPPEQILARHLGPDTAAVVPGHSFRATIADEFLEILRLGLDDSGRILEQLNHYRLFHPQVMEEAPFWSGLMIRRHNRPDVVAAMRLWLMHLLRYSRRDQVSGPLVFRQAGLAVERLAIDNLESWFHRWPVVQRRDRSAFPFSPHLGQLPADMLTREWTRQIEELQARNRALGARTAELEVRLAELQAGNAALEGALAKMRPGERDAQGRPDEDVTPGETRQSLGRAIGALVRSRRFRG